MKSSVRLAVRAAFNASTKQSINAPRRPQSLKPSATFTFRPVTSNPLYQQSFRRVTTEAAPSAPKRRRGGFFRWTWRLTYVSALAGTGFVAYEIYLLRTPNEQFEPDPSKKTLVVLGKFSPPLSLVLCSRDARRDRLGLHLSPEETRHRELQCDSHLSAQLLSLHPSPSVMHDRSDRASIHHGTGPQHPAP